MMIYKCQQCGTERIYGTNAPDTPGQVYWLLCEGTCEPANQLHHFVRRETDPKRISEFRRQSKAKGRWAA